MGSQTQTTFSCYIFLYFYNRCSDRCDWAGRTNGEQRTAFRWEEAEPEPALASEDWPQSSGPIRPTWWYRLWEEEEQSKAQEGAGLQSIQVPTRTEVEIAAATRYKQQIVSKGINPALRETLQQCRRGE